MSRPRDVAKRSTLILLGILAFSLFAGTGCEELDGRNRTRQGNRLFRETRFIEAVAEYEKAMKTVKDPIVHYNAGLAYSKIFKPVDAPIRMGVKGSFTCEQVPGTKTESAKVCIKEGDTRFENCDDKNVCASSFQCLQSELCVMDPAKIAEASATHFQEWLKGNPKDDETRKLMTQVWLDSDNYKLAIEYWESLLAAKPGDSEIMGNLAGINLKAGDWRKSVSWYLKVVEVSPDVSQKVSALQFIGNVAWSKLNTKALTGPEQIELADFGIGALSKAAELAPKNPKLYGLQASLYNFRALAEGASFASSIDRANGQDLSRISRVLAEEAKKAAGQAAPETTPTPTPSPVAPAAGGPAEKSGG